MKGAPKHKSRTTILPALSCHRLLFFIFTSQPICGSPFPSALLFVLPPLRPT
ncbi:hypothetical protein BJX68DRAFT_245942 [Aspergillus pseudodeflectus]|uniref:Uncharacterized protein n=1 Tax=Aspergillus pseudodeflectus TaxID=176178 RepID=A0ABR4JQ28_9EURO